MLGYMFHKAKLSFHGLKKDRNRAIAETVCLASQEVDLDIHLEIFTKYESGNAEKVDEHTSTSQ